MNFTAWLNQRRKKSLLSWLWQIGSNYFYQIIFNSIAFKHHKNCKDYPMSLFIEGPQWMLKFSNIRKVSRILLWGHSLNAFIISPRHSGQMSPSSQVSWVVSYPKVFFGQVMFSHHSDQMSTRPQSLCSNCCVKPLVVSCGQPGQQARDRVTHWAVLQKIQYAHWQVLHNAHISSVAHIKCQVQNWEENSKRRLWSAARCQRFEHRRG